MLASLYTANNQITNTISTFVESQTPGFIKDDANSNFVAFLSAYYQWAEQIGLPTPNSTNFVYQMRNLLSYDDVDTTIDGFLQYYINDFLPYFPNKTALSTPKLIKIAKEFYQQKGTTNSLMLLFQLLYNEQISVYYPKDNILRASDGKWTQPQAVRLLITNQFQNFNFNLLVGRVATGQSSGATCTIESAFNTVDPGLGFEVTELFISNLSKPFNDLEFISVPYGTAANGNPLIFSEQIISELSGIVINPNFPGLLYQSGNPVVITGGLEPNDPNAQKAVAVVGNVTSGSLTTIGVAFGGYNYRQNPNTIVTVVNAPGDNTGAGAQVIVSALQVAQSQNFLISTDAIFNQANVAINAASYGFANNAAADQNATIGGSLSYANLQFAPLLSLQVLNGGGAYRAVPSLNLQDVYFTNYTNDPTTEQYIDDLGMIAAVQVLAGGASYSNITDAIYCQGVWGNNATFNFTTLPNGAISSVSVLTNGNGYFQMPSLLVANSQNSSQTAAGSGAALQAFGFGQGATFNIGVSQIGQIEDIDMISRGFDYISTPNVSLAVEDVVILPFSNSAPLLFDNVVYQGATVNSATYIAFIDSYDTTSGVLRLYNYRGSLNIFQNIVAQTITLSQINLIVNTACTANLIQYGNGLARANALFLNGLIKYPGFWEGTDGFLSWDQHLQDSNTYHNYSYQIYAEQSLADYKGPLTQIAHPAGMSMLGVYLIPVVEQENIIISPAVEYLPPLTGSITTNAMSNGVLTGVGTAFLTYANVPNVAMIVFNTSDSSRIMQTKVIQAVVNDVYLIMESNTAWTYLSPISVISGSNIVYSSRADFVGNIAMNDVVLINVNGTMTYASVSSLTANQLTCNVTFGSNINNVLMVVFPSYVGASYQIITPNNAQQQALGLQELWLDGAGNSLVTELGQFIAITV